MAYDPIARQNSRVTLYIILAVLALIFVGLFVYRITKEDVADTVVVTQPSPTPLPTPIIIKPDPVIVPNPLPPSPPVVINPNPSVIITPGKVIKKETHTVIEKNKTVVATPTPTLEPVPTRTSNESFEEPLHSVQNP